MRNRVEFQLPPDQLFLNPAEGPGFHAIEPSDWFWRARKPARVLALAASEHPEILDRMEQLITRTARHKTFARAVEFNTIPVLLDQAAFKKSYVTAGGRAVLSGASGVRLLNRYVWENEDAGVAADDALADYFAACQARNQRLFGRADPPGPEVPFAVECRNTFNYYHFLTESLCQLTSVQDLPGQRPIFLHFPNVEDKTRPFTRAFVQALFPELQGRVAFERSPRSYDRAIVPYNLMNSYYHYGDSLVDSLDRLIDSAAFWQGRRASRASHAVLEANAVDRNLIRLRERGLQAIAGRDFSHLPRRFYVTRLESHARVRALRGEDELVEMLKLFGFQTVAFETLSPLEQIALMAQAEVMVAPHGAGFANMIFANPASHVIELGTLQTGMYRWGDFRRLAHVSGATYVSVLADFATDTPTVEPKFSEDGIVPVHLSRQGLAILMTFLATLLGHVALYPRPEDVLRLARQMNQAGAYHRTIQLLARHDGIHVNRPELCQLLAEAHRELGQGRQELAALQAARDAQPHRTHPALQVVWCAHKLGDRAEIEAALAALRRAFPERYDDLVRDRPWGRT